ncbi:hypothetical protein PUV47_16540 [Pseudovibrio exalbescens]|uniref:hypothetical protein n=1 Tax=Pseudovibrio exalbescens TaxID=197461 RepID=UPI00236567EF|nr:hypothetical protein [Pseudovibrio exalbescens]MDD7911540.1 hypothetical protein [Pseudovibrio exalbescens]
MPGLFGSTQLPNIGAVFAKGFEQFIRDIGKGTTNDFNTFYRRPYRFVGDIDADVLFFVPCDFLGDGDVAVEGGERGGCAALLQLLLLVLIADEQRIIAPKKCV